jgi:hypothetical protein
MDSIQSRGAVRLDIPQLDTADSFDLAKVDSNERPGAHTAVRLEVWVAITIDSVLSLALRDGRGGKDRLTTGNVRARRVTSAVTVLTSGAFQTLHGLLGTDTGNK